MNRVAVTSSNLLEVGYDSATSTLEVAFKRGGVYQYSGVPSYIHEGIMAAASPGGYFDVNVKKAGYVASKVSP